MRGSLQFISMHFLCEAWHSRNLMLIVNSPTLYLRGNIKLVNHLTKFLNIILRKTSASFKRYSFFLIFATFFIGFCWPQRDVDIAYSFVWLMGYSTLRALFKRTTFWDWNEQMPNNIIKPYNISINKTNNISLYL